MFVFGHRGFSGQYPENTMLAFRKAEEIGADGVELDVHLSKDGELMVIHDEALVRTTGRPGVVQDYTRKELERIKASRTKDDAFDVTIPSFEEYCDFASRSAMVTNIEIKTNRCWDQDIERKTVAMVHRFGLEKKVVFSSFNWISAVTCKRLAPEIPSGLLYEREAIRHLPAQAKDFGMEFIHPDFALLDEECVAEARALGVGINVWTINTEERMRQCMAWDLRSVISNNPDLCLRLLGRS